MKEAKILVLGATGYTGRLVVDELIRCEFRFDVCGRDKQKLLELTKASGLELPLRVLDIANQDQFVNLLEEYDVVINCIGPFRLYCADLIRAVSEWPGIYIDISGELDFALNSLQSLGQTCHSCRCLVIHGCAFESALAELLMEKIAEADTAYRDISSYYRYSNGKMSPGTRLTAQLANKRDALIFRDDNYRPIDESDLLRTPGFASDEDSLGFYSPLPEVAFFAESYQVRNTGSYLLLPATEARFLCSFHSDGNTDTEKILAKHRKRKPAGPSPGERRQHRFEVTVEATDDMDNHRYISALGVDPYGMTAVFVRLLLGQILAQHSKVYGVKSPGEILRNNRILERLQAEKRITISSD